MLTTTISIEIGDVLFCVNSSEYQCELPSRSLHFSYEESSTLRLIHKKDVVYDRRFTLISSLPRNPFFQIVIVDDTIRFTVEKSITKECVVISSVNKSGFFPRLIL